MVATKSKTGTLSRVMSGSGGVAIFLVVLFVALSVAAPNFLTVSNLVNVVDQVTVLGILAVGGTMVIITGGIDLSVGSVVGLGSMTMGFLSHQAGLPMWVAMLAALAAGAAGGLVNGLGVTLANLPPFIATLAMMSVARGIANLITNGQQIVGYPEWFDNLSMMRYMNFLSITTVVLIITYVIGWIVLRYRRAGRSIYAIGGGAEVARLAGINVRRVTIGVYTCAGALAALGGIILATRLDSSVPSAGTGYELNVIAAVVIGGASLSGGIGRISGTVVGVLIMGLLSNGLNLLGISPFIQSIIIGLIIGLAVMTDTLRHHNA